MLIITLLDGPKEPCYVTASDVVVRYGSLTILYTYRLDIFTVCTVQNYWLFLNMISDWLRIMRKFEYLNILHVSFASRRSILSLSKVYQNIDFLNMLNMNRFLLILFLNVQSSSNSRKHCCLWIMHVNLQQSSGKLFKSDILNTMWKLINLFWNYQLVADG